MSKSIIGHYARIPLHVARAPVSEMAKAVWRELAFVSSPEKPEVWVRQASIALKLNRSTRTIQRALCELLANGLLSFAGWAQGRYKKYRMAWQRFCDKNVVGRTTPVSDHLRHPCRPIIREAQQSTQQIIFPESPEIKVLEQKFPSLDGRAGRPSVVSCIEQALNHQARHKYDDIKVYLMMWLQNASAKWQRIYTNELGLYVESSEEQKARFSYEERRRQREEQEVERYFGPRILQQ